MIEEPVPIVSYSELFIVFCIFAFAWYTLCVAQTPQVFACRKLEAFLDFNVRSLREKYWPSPLFIDGRLQTIFGYYRRKTNPNELPYEREIFTFSDGGQVALDYLSVEQPKSKRPLLVLFIPGLVSISQTSYVRTLVLQFLQAGAAACVYNQRGNAGVPFQTTKTYSASNYDDLVEVLDHLRQKFPNYRMIALGTSLGGMILSKYVICNPKDAKDKLEAAILISIAWDLHRGNKNFEKPFVNKYIINRYLTRSLVKLARKLVEKFQHLPLKFDPEKVWEAYTIREFDAALTAPNFDFANVDDYYADCSSVGLVHKYAIPVFALSAEDDPLQPGYLLPTKQASAPGSKLALITTAYGGHLGWIEGFTKHSTHFMERVIGELVRAIRMYGTEELAGI